MEKIWLKSYMPGVDHEINSAKYPSLVSLFEESCAKFSGQESFLFMGKSITYRQLDEMSSAIASYLQAQGIQKGDRVALMMPNMFQYPVAIFGVLKAGGVVVNTNPLYTPRELEFVLNDSGAKAIIIVENFASTLQQVIGRTQVKSVVVTPLGELLGGIKGPIVNFVVKHVKKMVPAWKIPGSIRFRKALSIGRSHALTQPSLSHEDLAFLQYTGGTTGVPKGAELTHGNIASNVLQAYGWIKPLLRESQEFIVTALPLYHIFALTANCMVFLTSGARNLLIANPRDLPNLIKQWSQYPVTCFTAVNTLFNAMVNHPDFVKLNFSTLRLSLGGGMAVQSAVAEKWLKTVGSPIIQAYGLTETSPAATINPMDQTQFNGSIGLPIASTLVSIRDESGKELPVGETGEICIAGPQVMRGYWKRPDETDKVFWPDRYLRTGDMGYINDQGYVFLVDRKKDMILVSGFNVYPNEVEDAVVLHPGVLECAAVGIPDEYSGEIVKLFVVRKDPSLTEEAVIAHCRTQLTGYKVPKQVEFRDELPKTNVGKILRRALRDAA